MTAQLRAKPSRKPVGWLKREIADRACKQCGKSYRPARPLQSACSLKCALKLSRPTKRNLARKRREDREKIMSRSDWLKRAQVIFNRYVNLRDRGKPCIACNKPMNGAIHASHFRTTKAASHLRFDERNCASGCVKCNVYLSGNITAYRINLINRIGLAEVESLENDHTSKTWSIDELKELGKYYRQLSKRYADN